METNPKVQKETETKSDKKPNIKLLIVAISILIIGVIYFYLSQQKSFIHLNSNQNFIFQTLRGQEFNIKTSKNHIKITELRGKIVFLKVFGWDCKYCRKEIPELIKLKNKFETAFDTIAIEAQHHSTQANLDFIKKLNINYNIIDGDKQKIFFDYLKQEYKWDGVIPLTIVIDANGKILAFEVGYKSYSLTTLLQTTLKQLTTVATSTEKGEN